MNIRVLRLDLTDKSTIGELYINDAFTCYTLEDVVRQGPKVHGQTAIPAGRYRIIVNHSIRFDRDLPLLLDVPDFSGIRIHSGNTDKDTEGCILVGLTKAKDFIGNSRDAFRLLFPLIQNAISRAEEVWIDIIGGK